MDDLYTLERGVKIPTIQIRQVEDEYGVKLVGDESPKTLLALDLALDTYKMSHDNKEPDVIMLPDYPEKLFKHMVLNIQFLGMEIPGSSKKPAWFWFKKTHPIYKTNLNIK